MTGETRGKNCMGRTFSKTVGGKMRKRINKHRHFEANGHLRFVYTNNDNAAP